MADETKTPPVDPKDATKEAERLKNKELSINERLERIHQERNKLAEKLSEYTEKTLKDYEAIITPKEEELLLANKKYELEKHAYIQMKNALEEKKKLTGEISVLEQGQLEELEGIVDKLEESAENGKKLKDALNDISSSATHVLEKFTGINGKAQQLAKSVEAVGGYGNYFKKQMGLVSKKITHANVNAAMMLKLYEKTAAAAKKIYEWTGKDTMEAIDITSGIDRAIQRQDDMRLASRDVAILTARDMGEFKNTMMRLGKETDATTEDFVRINKEMYNTSNVFRELKNNGDPAVEGMQKMAHTLQRRLNIPIADTAKMTDTLSQTFGMAEESTMGFTNSLVILGKDMGLNVNKLLPDFQAQANNLAKFNLPDLRGEFLRLAKVSQVTGIGMDSIVNSMEQFSTFEGAAKAAANLNAVFGTTLDHFEMMDKFNIDGPVEAFIHMREQMEATSDIDFANMGFSEIRAMKGSINLGEKELKAFGSVSVEELRRITAGTTTADEAFRRLNEGREEGQTTAEKQKNLMDNMTTQMDKFGVMADNTNRAMMDAVDGMEALAGSIKMVANVFGTYIIGKVLAGLLGKLVPGLATTAASWFKVGGAAKFAGLMQKMASGGGLMAAAGSALAVGAAALGGGYIGHKINEGIYGEGNVDYNLFGSNVFDSGTNSAPPGIATLNNDGGTETISGRATAMMSGGEKVERTPPGPEAGDAGAIKLTINFVTKEGKNLETYVKLLALTNPITAPMAVYDIVEDKLNLVFND